jgi:serine/threonine protein kinase
MENSSLQTQGKQALSGEQMFSGEHALAEKRFGGYAMLEHLGKGGMGDVYKALQIGLDRIVALKILPSILARNTEFSERFFTEAYAISRLQHQNIVTIYDYGDEAGQKYIAMQYVQGTTLSKIIKESKKLEYERIVAITKQICRGLKYAHQNEIVHRDIKSGNIMIEPGDKVYIADFGIAKVVDAPSITTTGMAMGTPEYMAPEQCEGGQVDGQSDIYGLGIIIYEMVTGRPPFLADTPLAVAYKQVHDTPPLLSKKCPDVPRRLELIVAKCLKKSKTERYRNADELLQDLDSAHFEMAPTEPTDSSLPSDLRITDRRGRDRRNIDDPMVLSRGYLWGILGLFALVICALAYMFFRPSTTTGQVMRWLSPIAATGPSVAAGNEGPMRPENIFDGKRSTAWAAFSGVNQTEVELNISLAKKMFLTAMVIEAGMQFADGSTPAFSFPRTVTIEVEGRKPIRFNLLETDAPQVINLSGIIADNAKVRFGIGNSVAAADRAAGTGKPIAVREIRFLGLPYE